MASLVMFNAEYIALAHQCFPLWLNKIFEEISELILNIRFFKKYSIPGSSSFVGEILILTGVFEENTTTAVFATIGMFLGGIYSLLFYNRICYGNIQNIYLQIYYDLTYREFLIHLILIVNIFLLGLYPKIFESCLHESVSKILIHIDFSYFY